MTPEAAPRPPRRSRTATATARPGSAARHIPRAAAGPAPTRPLAAPFPPPTRHWAPCPPVTGGAERAGPGRAGPVAAAAAARGPAMAHFETQYQRLESSSTESPPGGGDLLVHVPEGAKCERWHRHRGLGPGWRRGAEEAGGAGRRADTGGSRRGGCGAVVGPRAPGAAREGGGRAGHNTKGGCVEGPSPCAASSFSSVASHREPRPFLLSHILLQGEGQVGCIPLLPALSTGKT